MTAGKEMDPQPRTRRRRCQPKEIYVLVHVSGSRESVRYITGISYRKRKGSLIQHLVQQQKSGGWLASSGL